MIVRFTDLAQQDVRDILRQTSERFGPGQTRVYAALLDHAQSLLAANPFRPGSLDRSALWPGIRLFHLELAAAKTGAASHCLYYQANADEVIVLRVLHQRMEPATHLIAALSQG